MHHLHVANLHIKKLQENKFAILDTIRNINCENTLPVTISIGVGRDGDSLYEDLQRANGALDLALDFPP